MSKTSLLPLLLPLGFICIWLTTFPQRIILNPVFKDIGDFLKDIAKAIKEFFQGIYNYIVPIALFVLLVDTILFFVAVSEWGWMLGIINLIVFAVALVKTLGNTED